MRICDIGIFCSLVLASSALANPKVYIQEPGLSGWDSFGDDARQKNLRERDYYKQLMQKREEEIQAAILDPTKTLNVPRGISSPTFESDVVDPAISAAATVGGALIPGDKGKVAGAVFAKSMVDGYNNFAGDPTVQHAAHVGVEFGKSALKHVENLFQGRDTSPKDLEGQGGLDNPDEDGGIFAREIYPDAYPEVYRSAIANKHANSHVRPYKGASLQKRHRFSPSPEIPFEEPCDCD